VNATTRLLLALPALLLGACLVWFFAHDGLSVMARDNAIARLIRLFS